MTELIWLDERGRPADPTQGWWARYRESLANSSLSSTAQAVLEQDCTYVVEQIIRAGEQPLVGWSPSRLRSGMVMGAVQSGKTASMLGVAAKALDGGVDVVVVLAGTRVALWRQTYDRLLAQLDRSDRSNQVERADARVLVPSPELLVDDEEGRRPTPQRLYQVSSARAKRALAQRQPFVLVVMKHAQHLRAASEVLRRSVYPHLDRDAHILVLDDEADDGSVLDAEVERALDPATDPLKQIPRHIVDLWSERVHAPATLSPLLRATYVGYTATPQANFLQSDQNPLAPRDFVCALRTPSDHGDVDHRSTTYREPAGLQAFYTGGDAFYRRIPLSDDASLVIPYDAGSADESEKRTLLVAEAMRAYLVAGAVRVMNGAVLPESVRDAAFGTRGEASQASPRPHSMLYHPSAAVEDHFSAAAELIAWGNGVPQHEALDLVASGVRSLSVEAVEEDLNSNHALWLAWLCRYAATAVALRDAYDDRGERPVPSESDWSEVQRVLLAHVVPAVRVAVVNSDPEADDRPEFEPRRQVDGTWRAARDLMTVFVSGNVMARGLTLEGLCTTLFLRSSAAPVADTQMQMQRWFGYRGADLELCRVIAPADQVELFRQYHETDEALRRQIVREMETGRAAPTPLVLEGSGFAATAKIAGVAKVPLCPGAAPFVDVVNAGDEEDPNLRLVAELFTEGSVELTTSGTVRGRILPTPLAMLDTASLLDRLTYNGYRPSRDDVLADRWRSLESQLAMPPDDPLTPFFRGPAHEASEDPVVPRRCPYTVAAYLRAWEACLSRRASGLFPTDDGSVPWSQVDLRERRELSPHFYVGLRFGSAEPIDGTVLDELPFTVRPMSRPIVGGRVRSTWGTQGVTSEDSEYRGDRLFDYVLHQSRPTPTDRGDGVVWRPLGAPGLVLLQVVCDDSRPRLSLAVGVSIPLGGPDHFAARTRRRS